MAMKSKPRPKPAHTGRTRSRSAAKPTGAVLDLDELRIRPATPARWGDIELLFGERGACGGCWCMAWRLPRARWVAGKARNGAGNKREFQKVVASNEQPGVIAYLGRRPVGWCAVAPRVRYPALERSRVLKPVDDQPVWSITCLFVFKPYRGRGVSARLLEAAAELAARRGASVVEGYPVEPSMQPTPDPFLWLGTPEAFRRAGFQEVARRSKARPIMRRTLAGRTLAGRTLAGRTLAGRTLAMRKPAGRRPAKGRT